MSSTIFSRLLPPDNGSPSIYETIRQHEEDSDTSDLEERAGLSFGNQNSAGHYRDVDLDDDQFGTSQVSGRAPVSPSKKRADKARRLSRRPRWLGPSRELEEVEEAEDDVPASLLIEGAQQTTGKRPPDPTQLSSLPSEPIPLAGPSNAKTERQWQQTREQQALYETDDPPVRTDDTIQRGGYNPLTLADRKQKAMWRWTNVQNLDLFLGQVYDYYIGNGFWAIILYRCFNLITGAFLAGFIFFLTQCIDYSLLRGSTRMSQVLIARCAGNGGPLPNIFLWLATLVWLLNLFSYVARIRNLLHMHDFYHHLLNIPESDIQSTTWQDIVSRLMALRDSNPQTASGKNEAASRRFLGTQNKQRMDAHDIANRLMRRENYLIAMFNKDLFDTTLPLPFIGPRQFFSRTLEWNIYQCVFDFVFDPNGQIRPLFLKDTHRKQLSEGLRRRFIFAGFSNLITAPIIILYNLVQFFFQNFNEYQKNPAQIGSRRYSPLAEWKFREFNEVYHIFERRMNMSYPFASRYVDQFPKAKTVLTARFITFITGALISVLFVASALDPDLFFGFEITHDRTVLFYIGVFGSIWAVARGLLPDENAVHDTAYTMGEIVQFTHYCPPHWQGRLNSDEVRRDFMQLYQLKLMIFLQEVFSLFFAPFVLWYTLPKCSERIIDFFREFTVHVDGMGYLCSFAEFNFQKNGNIPPGNLLSEEQQQRRGTGRATTQANGAVVGLRDAFYATNNQKLEASYWGFMNDYARNPKTDVRFPYHAHRQLQQSANLTRFHPPPPVPGLLTSPTLPSTDPMAVVPEHSAPIATSTAVHSNKQGGGGILDRLVSSTRRPPTTAGSMAFQSGTPRFSAAGTVTGPAERSPLHSMLLDPHHQPTTGASGLASSPVALRPVTRGSGGGSKSRVGLGAKDAVREETVPPPAQPPSAVAAARGKGGASQDQVATTTPRREIEDSGGELGSWKMDHGAGSDDEDDEDEDAAVLRVLEGRADGGAGGGVLGLLRQFQRAQGAGEGRRGMGIRGGGVGGVGGAEGGI